MIVKLCRRCKETSERMGLLDKVLNLCRAHCWLCPRGNERCGEIEGRTQAQQRDDVFLQAIAEMIVEREPNKIN